MITFNFIFAALLVAVVAGTSPGISIAQPRHIPGISVRRNFLSSSDIASLNNRGECKDDLSNPASPSFRTRGILPASIRRKLTTVLPDREGSSGEVQFTIIEGTTPIHTDCVMDDEGGILPGVDINDVETVFIFLNTNPNAQFVYSPNHVSNGNEEVRVDVVAGDLVRFKASTFHRTELSDGFVNLLGPLTSVNNRIQAVQTTPNLNTLDTQGVPFNVTTTANKKPAQVACASTGTTSSVATGEILTGDVNATVGVYDVLMDQLCNNSTLAEVANLTTGDRIAMLSQVGAVNANSSYPWWTVLLETCTVTLYAAPDVYGGKLVSSSDTSATGILDTEIETVLGNGSAACELTTVSSEGEKRGISGGVVTTAAIGAVVGIIGVWLL